MNIKDWFSSLPGTIHYQPVISEPEPFHDVRNLLRRIDVLTAQINQSKITIFALNERIDSLEKKIYAHIDFD